MKEKQKNLDFLLEKEAFIEDLKNQSLNNVAKYQDLSIENQKNIKISLENQEKIDFLNKKLEENEAKIIELSKNKKMLILLRKIKRNSMFYKKVLYSIMKKTRV